MLLTKRFAAGAFAGLLCASILAAPAAAQTTATASITAKAQVTGVAPLTAAGIRDLNFGTVTAGGGAFHQSTPSQFGLFSVGGQPTTPVSISFSLPTVLTGPASATIPITFGSTDAAWTQPGAPSGTGTFSPSATTNETLDNAGNLNITITGTVNPPAMTVTGLYTGTITLTVSY